jgi:hypothetical protein
MEMPKLSELDESQLHVLRSCLAKFMAMAEAQVPEPPEDADTSEIADILVENWRKEEAPELDESSMASIVGCMCGELLRSYLRVRWMWAADEFGEGLALWGELNDETLILYPIDSVEKRLQEPGQTLTEWVFSMLEQENVQKFLRPEDEDAPSIFED